MARLARVILPGYPHHIIQRGNGRQDVFFCDEDYLYYLELLKEWCRIELAESILGLDLRKKKPGPKIKNDD
jgi:REP element-mobilizing transposase RayT